MSDTGRERRAPVEEFMIVHRTVNFKLGMRRRVVQTPGFRGYWAKYLANATDE
jgi:hypothetical protein